MSRSAERIKNVTDKLKNAFENTPYYLAVKNEEEIDTNTNAKDDVILSVIIPARNEFPNIIHTMYSIWHCWEADGFSSKDIEIIVVDNGSLNWHDPKYEYDKPGDRGTVTYLMPRGAFNDRRWRVLYDPICGNHSARNKGARIARGKYLFFSDAHMSYKPGFFKYGLKAVDESGGMVHGGINWMGAYAEDHLDNRTGLQYTIKLGEEWKGTWNNYRPWNDSWFYIPAQGHCSVLVKRQQFLDFGGYPDVHRTYGGGEFFINMLWWMYGSTVVAEPRCVGYHLASGRGYSWTHDDYIENVLGCSYALGCDDWRERAYINYLRRGRKEVLDKMMERSAKEHKPRRDEIEKRKIKTFNELIVERPWDKMNMDKGGSKNSSLLVFHDTWLPLLEQSKIAKEAYDNSTYQKDLEKFINDNLSQYVYKRVLPKKGE